MFKPGSGAVLALLLAIPAVALSHAEGDSDVGPQWMDCDHLPADAASALPAPISDWTRLDCRVYGQVLAQGSGWTWRYTGTFTKEVIVAAVMGDAAHRQGGPRHFTGVRVLQVHGKQALQMHEQLAREVPSYGYFAAEMQPYALYTLEAVNDVGDTISLHFVEQAEDRLWGIACTPDCKPENVFQVDKVGG